MSLYSQIFNVRSEPVGFLMVLAGAIEVQPARMRNAWLEYHEGDVNPFQVCLYARIGGGNRECYEENWEAIRALPSYLSDRDDSFDSTYAEIRFASAVPPFDPQDDKMRDLFFRGQLDHGKLWEKVLREIPEHLEHLNDASS